MLSEFSSGHICACYKGLGYFHLDGANLQLQSRLVPKIMHQNRMHYKNSFIVLVPGCEISTKNPVLMGHCIDIIHMEYTALGLCVVQNVKANSH